MKKDEKNVRRWMEGWALRAGIQVSGGVPVWNRNIVSIVYTDRLREFDDLLIMYGYICI